MKENLPNTTQKTKDIKVHAFFIVCRSKRKGSNLRIEFHHCVLFVGSNFKLTHHNSKEYPAQSYFTINNVKNFLVGVRKHCHRSSLNTVAKLRGRTNFFLVWRRSELTTMCLPGRPCSTELNPQPLV